MGRKAVYRENQTSVRISPLASILLGYRKSFNETKGDFIERLIIEMTDPELLKVVKKELKEAQER